ncbi:hypothetical protein ACFOZY_06655 [Chungangia koreensis]|uniref:Uncharacterized protein n=1 Tax=Chungangia koreensis TaxID=752657 RepID=A0ABV8X4A0_9LACT
MNTQPNGKYTEAGTDIEEVKKRNAESGMTYNEVKEMLARSITKEAAERTSVPSNSKSI